MEVLTPRASNGLAASLLTTRATQEDRSLQLKLTARRWLPEVEAQLEADCNVPDADKRRVALSRRLQAAINSRHGLTGVRLAWPMGPSAKPLSCSSRFGH